MFKHCLALPTSCNHKQEGIKMKQIIRSKLLHSNYSIVYNYSIYISCRLLERGIDEFFKLFTYSTNCHWITMCWKIFLQWTPKPRNHSLSMTLLQDLGEATTMFFEKEEETLTQKIVSLQVDENIRTFHKDELMPLIGSVNPLSTTLTVDIRLCRS